MRMWKRIAIAVLLAVLLPAAVGAQAATKKKSSPKLKEKDIIGVWYLYSVYGQDAVFSDVEITLNFKKGGKMTITVNDGTKEGSGTESFTWKINKNGMVVLNNKYMSMSFYQAGNGEIGDDSGRTYSKKKSDLRRLPKTVAAESEQAFFGTWKVAYDYDENQKVLWPISRVENPYIKLDEVRVVISEGKVDLTIPSAEEEYQYEVHHYTFPCELIDGRLAFPDSYSENGLIYIDYLETGELYMQLHPETNSMYALTKAE